MCYLLFDQLLDWEVLHYKTHLLYEHSSGDFEKFHICWMEKKRKQKRKQQRQQQQTPKKPKTQKT